MYGGVLVITINSYYSKVPSTGTAVLLRSTVPTTAKSVMNFKTGAFIPAILNLASHKANQLSASCDQKGGNLKLKFEVKLSLLAENVFSSADCPEKPGWSSTELDGDSAEFSIML